MNLKSLEISGFKSFSKKTALEFSTPITGIVGPNGSGKSNVAEAFRFVLGEQSMKSLRGKRGEDLIYNGGASAGRLNRAAVKLVFDNADRSLALDFDEVILERVVHRDSANEYFINGSPSRLKDIVELLTGAHIGASGHHIISQGEADRILNANLKERREMIEDALGLKIYHYKREESERKLEKTAENILQVESLRKEIAPHLRFLEKQMEKIEKTEKVRQELIDRAREYFKRESAYIRVHKNRLAEEERPLVEHEAALKRELAAAKAVLEKAAERGMSGAAGKGGGKKDPGTEKLLDFEKQLAAVRAEREEAARQAGRLEGEIASEERTIRREEALARSQAGRMVPLSEVEETLATVESRLTEAEGIADPSLFKKIAASIKDLLKQFIHRYRTETAPLDNLAQSARVSIETLKENRQTLAEKLTALGDAEKDLIALIAELRVIIEKEKDTNRDAEKAVFRIMAEHNELISKLAAVRAHQTVLASVEHSFKNDLGDVAALAGRAVADFDQYVFSTHLSDEDMAAESRDHQEGRRKHIERLKIRIEEAGAGGGEDVVKEYTEAKHRDEFLAREIADLEKSAETLGTLIADLEEKLDTEFKAGVTKINDQFGQFFALMFGGGAAKLEVVKAPVRARRSRDADDEDLSAVLGDHDDDGMGSGPMREDEETEEGIDIAVNLPKKRIKGLTMLSGGERALTSIALLFAISQVNPPPFIILDETDAALDEANSRKYGDMIENLSKYSQLILITHNRETMSRAGVLYGVTMTAEGSSKLLSIKFDEAVVVAK
jgi:chromosome segregation protein